jgi:hypothetical protein
MNELHHYGTEQEERRRMMRQHLRVIQGGKATAVTAPNAQNSFDRTQLESDPFLREHYLGKPKVNQVPLNEQLKFFLFGMKRENPQDAS